MAVSQMRKQQLYNPKTLDQDQDQANHPWRLYGGSQVNEKNIAQPFLVER